ncbi:MAG: amino acid ABC transporter substrate-binding protein [Clostridiales bacterium]|nr:amino acid ABC transporter substrate-binding protein [Clostridiales bacterium]
MKKVFALLLVLSMVLSFSALAETVKIGVFEPASGDSGAGGKQEMLGMQYANKETPTVEIGGTTYDVELVYADNGSSTDKAPSAAQQLVSENVSLVLGSYGSGVSIAGSQYFADAGIPAIGVTCTNPQVTAGNSHYFRVCFLDPFQGTVLANYAYKELGATTAYCLAELGNDYDVGLSTYFQQAFEALGGTVISDNFPTGTSDFTSYLTNAQMYEANVFFCPVSIAYSTQIVQQAASQGMTFPILGGDTLDSNVVANAAKGTNLDVVVTTFYQEGANEAFDSGFKAWLESDSEALTNNGGNTIIAGVTAMGYDAYYVALEALKAAGTTDSKAVMEALPAVEYDGVSGHIAFDETGDAIRNAAFVKKVNTETGDWEFVTEQTVE